MKKLMLFMLMLIGISGLVIGQVVEPPTSWEEVLMNPGLWFASFSSVSLVTVFITTFLLGVLKVTKGFVRQLIAWAVAIILVVVSSLLNIGYAAEFTIWNALLHGFFAGLASNGWQNIPILEGMLHTVEGWFNPARRNPPEEDK